MKHILPILTNVFIAFTFQDINNIRVMSKNTVCELGMCDVFKFLTTQPVSYLVYIKLKANQYIYRV